MWTTSHSVPIRAGQLGGSAFWNPLVQSYAARLIVFDSSRTYPPPVRTYGTRPGELVTADALANHLAAAGLPLDRPSLAALHDLAAVVDRTVGHSEVVGLLDEGRRRLLLVGPDGDLLELQPPVGHPAYDFRWGDASEATEETARVIIERVHGRTGPDEVVVLALTLTVELLAGCAGEFSINAKSLCDWLMADAALTTSCGADARQALHRRLTSARARRSAGGSSPLGTSTGGHDRR